MANDSTVAGYLLPAAQPAPLEDVAFREFIQQVIVGVTAMDPTMVRPRWQPEAVNLPDYATDWCAFGTIRRRRETFPYVARLTNDTGDELDRNEELDILCSFYGPNAEANSTLLSDGIQIGQNLDVLFNAGMQLVETGEPLVVPELIKQRWWYRVDIMLVIRRHIHRVYPVRSLVEAVGAIEVPIDTITVQP